LKSDAQERLDGEELGTAVVSFDLTRRWWLVY
jgi:hypothetical protein